MSALKLSTNFTLTSSFVFGHCLCPPCATEGEQKPPMYQGLRCQTLRYLTAGVAWDMAGRSTTRAYGTSINASGHVGATTPAVIASSGTKLRFNCLYPPVLPLLSSAAATVAATFFDKCWFPDGSRLPPCWDSVGEMSTFQDRLKTVPPKKQEESAGACREWLCAIVCVYRLQLSWQMALVSLIGNSERKLFLGERPLCSLTKGMRRGKEGPLHRRFNNSTSLQSVLYDTVMQWFFRELARWPGSPFP